MDTNMTIAPTGVTTSVSNYSGTNVPISSAEQTAQTKTVRQFPDVSEQVQNDTSNETQKKEVSKADIKKFTDFFQQKDLNVNFSVDKDTGTQVVQFIDPQSKQVVTQIPSQEMLHMIKGIDNFIAHNGTSVQKSLLLNTQA